MINYRAMTMWFVVFGASCVMPSSAKATTPAQVKMMVKRAEEHQRKYGGPRLLICPSPCGDRTPRKKGRAARISNKHRKKRRKGCSGSRQLPAGQEG